MRGTYGQRGMEGSIEKFFRSCPTLGLQANLAYSPIPGVSIIPKWQKHGQMYVYRPNDDAWLEINFKAKKVTQVFKRLDEQRFVEWERTVPEDGIFEAGGKRVQFTDSIMKIESNIQKLCEGVCLAPEFDGGSTFVYYCRKDYWLQIRFT